jgi:hypothetical protein
LAAGSYEYKFTNGNGWDISEFFSADAICVQGFFGNRSVTVGIENQILPVVCWNECVACSLIGAGCMDAAACNYDPNATQLDPTACTFATPGFDCDGNCLDINNNTICDNLESPALGCIDSTACDYDPAANTQDPGDACDFLLFQGFTSVVPASSDRAADGAVVPSIGGTGGSGTYFLRVTPIVSQSSSTGNKVYNISLPLGYAAGAELGSAYWSQMFPGRYRFELVDDAGCEAVDAHPVVIPVLRAAN